MFAHSSRTSRSGGSSGLPGLGRAVVGAGDDLLNERREERLQPALLVRRRAEVRRVVAAVEEPLGSEVGRQRPTRGRPDRRTRRAPSRRSCRCSIASGRRASIDAWNASSAAGSSACIERRSNDLLVSARRPSARHRPSCRRSASAAKSIGASSFAAAAYQKSALSTPACRGRAAADEPVGDPLRALPGARSRRAASSPRSGSPVPPGRVVDPDVRAGDRRPRGERLAQQIRLDRRRDDRPLPLEDRGDGEARSSCRSAPGRRRSPTGAARRRRGGRRRGRASAGPDAARLHAERSEVPRSRPPRAAALLRDAPGRRRNATTASRDERA